MEHYNTEAGGLHLALVDLCVEGVVTVHSTLSQVLKNTQKKPKLTTTSLAFWRGRCNGTFYSVPSTENTNDKLTTTTTKFVVMFPSASLPASN